MAEIVRSVLGGGWSILVGWILPTAINVFIFSYILVPAAGAGGALGFISDNSLKTATFLLATSVVFGLLLAAIQTPLYRLLEGYLGWRGPTIANPGIRHPWRWLLWHSHRRQMARRKTLSDRLELLDLTRLEKVGDLDKRSKDRLTKLISDENVKGYTYQTLGPLSAELVRELARYPISEDQVTPTRLGNAIRRLEEYGHDRFGLDSQVLWYEILATAPTQAVKEAERGRVPVDFMVSLLTGHMLVAIAAATSSFRSQRPWPIALLAVALLALTRLWYLIAVRNTDDWAFAVQSLINVGRLPLATALSLRMPMSLDDERKMWFALKLLVGQPFGKHSTALDTYRVTQPTITDPTGNNR